MAAEMSKAPIIAIVDDDPSVREAILDLMKSIGVVAEAFPSAAAFLKSGAYGNASCLIADEQMPEMGGLELYRRLVDFGYPVPTILMTTYPDDRIRMQALIVGVIGCVTKPFSDNDLIGYIDLVRDRRKAS